MIISHYHDDYSNTTLVKVKYAQCLLKEISSSNSNTTLVKVKYSI